MRNKIKNYIRHWIYKTIGTPHFEFEVGSAEDLPYSDGYFDKVVCSSSLEHFKDDIKALKEMNRVLKPNGKVVLTTDSFAYPIEDELKEKHSG